MFAKIRKEAKEKSKRKSVNTGIDEQFAKKDVKEVEPISETELNELLAAVNEVPPPAVEKPLAKADHVEKVIKAEPEKKLFQAMGVFYDSKVNKFMKILLDYDPVTCYTAINKIEELTDSSAVATVRVSQYYNLKLMRQEEIV